MALMLAADRCEYTEDKTYKLSVGIIPNVTQKSVSEVRQFHQKYAKDMGWALVGVDGTATLSNPLHKVEWVQRAKLESNSRATPPRSKRPFTTMHRWLMKIMLLANQPNERWNGPRCAHPKNVRELQVHANVAYETARTFVNTFRELGYLVNSELGLALVHKSRMLAALFQDEALVHRQIHYMRWAHGRPRSLHKELRQASAQSSVVAGGWEACRIHGVSMRGHDYVPMVHAIANPDSVAKSLSLIRCSENDAQLKILDSRKERSITEGAVRIAGIQTVDLLQAALDLAGDPDRGQEQLEHILRLLDLSLGV